MLTVPEVYPYILKEVTGSLDLCVNDVLYTVAALCTGVCI